jgi:hypothetical protein
MAAAAAAGVVLPQSSRFNAEARLPGEPDTRPVGTNPTLPATGSVANYNQTGQMPDYPGRFSTYYSGGGASGRYGGTVQPELPNAGNVYNMVPQHIQDAIGAQTARLNYLKSGAGGWLGLFQSGAAQKQLMALHGLALQHIGEGIKAGQLGVQQGQLGVQRGQLDVNKGHLDLGYGQLGQRYYETAPATEREMMANRIAGSNPNEASLERVGEFQRAFGQRPVVSTTTIAQPYQTIYGRTSDILGQPGRGPQVFPTIPSPPGGGAMTSSPTRYATGGMVPPSPMPMYGPNAYGYGYMQPTTVTSNIQ